MAALRVCSHTSFWRRFPLPRLSLPILRNAAAVEVVATAVVAEALAVELEAVVEGVAVLPEGDLPERRAAAKVARPEAERQVHPAEAGAVVAA